MGKIERKCNQILIFAFGLIMAVFSVASFIFSRVSRSDIHSFYNRVPIYRVTDNLLTNLTIPVFFVFLALLLERFSKKFNDGNDKKIKLILILISVLSALLSFWILSGGTRTPTHDQAQVYGAASLLNLGEYINLSPGGYVEMYVQQLGFIAYLQFIFKLFGNYNFQAAQYINCLWIIGIVYLGGRCCRHFSNKQFAQILGSIMLGAFIPLHLLSSWVYGDIPFYFFQFLFIDTFFVHLKKPRIKSAILLILFGVCSIIFRKNALILLIACAVALLFTNSKKYISKLALSALVITIPLLSTQCITAAYRYTSGHELKGGLPSICWISMGMSEGGKAGWFYDYCVPIYYSYDYDRELTTEHVLKDIKERAQFMADNPKYAAGFYGRKLFTQWNDPYYTTQLLIETDNPSNEKGITAFMSAHEKTIFKYLSSFQFMIYAFSFIYSIKYYRKRSITENIILIYLIGGFLFSILWEANSRYVLQYVITLFPMAVSALELRRSSK